MEGVNSDSAIASVTSNPGSFIQVYDDFDKCVLKDPGPILPKLSEFGSEEEKPFVEDICREERQCAFDLHWGKRSPRSRKVCRAAQTLVDIKRGKPNLRFLFKKILTNSNVKNKRIPKDVRRAAQTLVDIKRGKPNLRFLFKKILTNSDVKNKRIVLPKKEVDRHLADVCPNIETTVMICMKDFDLGRSWEFKYRLWNSEEKIMHVLQNTGELTEAHNLQVGDPICFYKDSEGNYVVRGKR